jgi:hypothetical protein
MLQEVKNVVSCLMKFLRKTKTLQQLQQQAGKQAVLSSATVPTPLLSSATTSQSNTPLLPRIPPTSTATGVAPAASATAAALPPNPPSSHAAASSALESTENVVVMDVADLILAAEIGHCPTTEYCASLNCASCDACAVFVIVALIPDQMMSISRFCWIL